MKKNVVRNVLFMFQNIVVEEREFSKNDLIELFKVTGRSIINYVNEINCYLYNDYIYKELKYDKSNKRYIVVSLEEWDD
ncbi:hypothetical protein KHQ82_05390 [Mycoplasmatota bacterium]|nr:hypothetical protein KHQ82_05390 [Mycoplasmatota bacterium]